MVTIRENRKNGKVVSYCFTACLERDARGKQVRKYTTWIPSGDLTPAKAKRVAERAALEWEDEIRAEHQKRKTAFVWPEVKRALKVKEEEPGVLATLKIAAALNEEEKTLKKRIKTKSAERSLCEAVQAVQRLS